MYMKQILLLAQIMCIIHLSECDTVLSSLNNSGSSWTFEKDSNVTFVCTIVPYTSSQAWKYESVTVSDCGLSSCYRFDNGTGRYTFSESFNHTYGVFYWTIYPMSLDYNEKRISCNDGVSGDISINITVTEPAGGVSTTSDDHYEYFAILALIPLIIAVYISCGYTCYGIKISLVDKTMTTAEFKIIQQNRRWFCSYAKGSLLARPVNNSDDEQVIRPLTNEEVEKQTFVINNLEPDTKFEVYIKVLHWRRTYTSKTVDVVTRKLHLTLEETTDTKAIFGIKTNVEDKDISYYLVVNSQQKELSEEHVRSGTYSLDGLEKYKQYTVRAEAKNHEGNVIAESITVNFHLGELYFEMSPKDSDPTRKTLLN